MRARKAVAAALIALGLTGCQNGLLTREDVGAIGGAIAGGLLGSQIGSGTGQTVAIIGGTLAGTIIGRRLAQQSSLLSEGNQGRAAQAEQQALSDNRTTAWSGSGEGADVHGEVAPLRSFTRDGRTCREYTHTITTPTNRDVERGIACQRPDGEWELVQS
jgi:surface antigen